MKPVILSGLVVKGHQKGRDIGFPTANLQLDENTSLPEFGVYASLVYVDDKSYPGITNIGTRPTADNENNITVETHVINYEGDLYDKHILVTIFSFLRDIQKFNSMEELSEQLKKDKAEALRLLS